MATRFKMIPIPRTPPSNFNNDRVASDLIRNQVRHACEELQRWIAQYGRIDPDTLETEQQAADYLAVVTRVLHPEVASKPALPSGRPAKSGISLGAPAPRSSATERQTRGDGPPRAKRSTKRTATPRPRRRSTRP